MLKAMKKKPKNYHPQLTPFDVGQIKAHREHGLSAAEISRRVFKSDGKSRFEETAIRNCLQKLEENPRWRGERHKGTAGRPRKTNPKQDKKIVAWLLDKRGEEKVSVSRLKKEFLFLRKLSNTLVEDRLFEANLSWLRRPKKSIVTKEYLQARIDYCNGIKRKHAETLERYCYTDGTVYYMDRNESEAEDSKRRSLGTHVWRRSDNKDAFYQDCLGPSAYSKGQGIPVKVWGMLACGGIYIHILGEGESMDEYLYTELVEDHFDDWRGNCEYMICDHERCLHTEMSLRAVQSANLKVVEFPKRSQDFNAMENAWFILRQRLDQTQPRSLEHRDEFCKRLEAAVQWANTHRKEQLWHLSTNQKERADACLSTKPPGGRTKW